MVNFNVRRNFVNGKCIKWVIRMIGIIVVVVVMFVVLVQVKEWKMVMVVFEGGYVLWNFMLLGGKLGGFELELFVNVCECIKVQCNMVVQDWDGMIFGL